jgi:hypothetical protein
VTYEDENAFNPSTPELTLKTPSLTLSVICKHYEELTIFFKLAGKGLNPPRKAVFRDFLLGILIFKGLTA